ncbi:MAG: glycosyltransferase [candidate division KSB1 bacterium]|nr:glycosyltransferase [candidate division KSB1 bacterium]MDZ7335026.1 glycosyltransferase [candidate division KSB1 bacterium]MDZ7357787.1 glycosyltransferase [candidate division KSB1 bacterium]MDZ7399395.1 glycosyltransferase [candidate division KSB1 bacterium]
MLKILHLSYDYTVSPEDNKTIAVRALIDETRHIAQCHVISLDRVASMKRERIASIGPGDVSIQSFGLPFGLFFKATLRRAYEKVLQAERMGLVELNQVDLIHAHKVSFEGYIGYLLAQRYSCALMVSIRQTDILLLKARPDLRPLARRILQSSTKIIYIVPYMIEAINKLLGEAFFKQQVEPKLVFLPNIVPRSIELRGQHPKNGVLMTALRLNKKTVLRKNLKNLFRALAEIDRPDIELQVLGDGEYLSHVRRWAEQLGIGSQVRFLGAVDNSKMDDYFANCTAFVLPSFSETFGYVYAEALLNGTPILYSKGTGFDGLFEGVGVAVDPHSIPSIREGLLNIMDRNEFYRTEIRRLHALRAFDIFHPFYARTTYLKCLNQIFGNGRAVEQSFWPIASLNRSVKLT